MKKWMSVIAALALCLVGAMARADGWAVPSRGGGSQYGGGQTQTFGGVSVQLIEDLATRSGPSTGYTGCGSYRMNGQYVTALSRRYDNGGVLWIEVEFSYGGGYRRAWTGAKRLNISANQLAQLPEEDPRNYLGYGTVVETVSPRFGPGSLYAAYSDRDYFSGDEVLLLANVNGYYLTECYMPDGKNLRSWILEDAVSVR